MSGITGMFGLGGNKNNASFQAQAAPLLQPVTQDQINNAYGQTQSGITQQQQFLNALMGQNGIANQSDVYAQQQALANQFQGVANGTGPNPAQAALNQATGQNVANQAALMAGQRGSNANVGLLGRQIAQQGAGIQQQAAGQGATMQAQQQLAALGALQGQQANMANLATQQVGQQQGALQGFNQFAQGQQQNLLGALGAYNNANVGMQSNMNSTNEAISGINANNQNKTLMGGLKGLPVVGSFFAEGGEVGGPQSHVAKYFTMAKGGKVVPGKASVKGNSLKNDTVPAMLSPGEIVLPRSVTKSEDPVGNATKFVEAILAKHGLRKKNG